MAKPWTELSPSDIIPEALKAMDRGGAEIRHVHLYLAAGQAIHLAKTGVPVFYGNIAVTPKGIRIRELSGKISNNVANCHVPDDQDARSGADEAAIERAFAPLTMMKATQLEAALTRGSASMHAVAQLDGSIYRDDLIKVGRALLKETATARTGVAAIELLPMAIEVLGPAWDIVATMLALSFAKGEHLRRYGCPMFDDKIVCHRDGILFGTIRKAYLDDSWGDSENSANSRISALQQERIKSSLKAVALLGPARVMAMARDPRGPFAGCGDDQAVRHERIADYLAAAAAQDAARGA